MKKYEEVALNSVCRVQSILGDPEATSRDDVMFSARKENITSSRLVAPGSPRMGSEPP